MIDYLFRMILCSGILLGVYHLLLKSERMFRFNRWYLLLAMVFSFCVPRISLPILPAGSNEQAHMLVEEATTWQNSEPMVEPAELTGDLKPTSEFTSQGIAWYSIGLGIYGLGMLLCLLVVGAGHWVFMKKKRRGQKQPFGLAQLILLKSATDPHTYLRNIFLDKTQYAERQIPPQVLAHEYAHAQQGHSWDVIFASILIAIGWFNPFFWLFRRAIQLNHELLADAAALKQHTQLDSYLQLLLRQAESHCNSASLWNVASPFHFADMKHRLKMINKETVKSRIRMKQLAVIPAVMFTLLIGAEHVAAQSQDSTVSRVSEVPQPPVPPKLAEVVPKPPMPPKVTATPHPTAPPDPIRVESIPRPVEAVPSPEAPPAPVVPDPSQREQDTFNSGSPTDSTEIKAKLQAEFDRLVYQYYTEELKLKDKNRPVPYEDKERMLAIYDQMPLDQKKEQGLLLARPGPMRPAIVTTEMMEAWQDESQYGVWYDRKRISNDVLATMNTNEIAHVIKSELKPNATNYGKHVFQLDLWSPEYLEMVNQKNQILLLVMRNGHQVSEK